MVSYVSRHFDAAKRWLAVAGWRHLTPVSPIREACRLGAP